MTSNGKAMPPLGATGANDCTAATSLHADTKAVRTLATNNRGLKSAFHDPAYLKKV